MTHHTNPTATPRTTLPIRAGSLLSIAVMTGLTGCGTPGPLADPPVPQRTPTSTSSTTGSIRPSTTPSPQSSSARPADTSSTSPSASRPPTTSSTTQRPTGQPTRTTAYPTTPRTTQPTPSTTRPTPPPNASSVRLDAAAGTAPDTLVDPLLSGRVASGRSGERVWTEVLVNGSWRRDRSATTGPGGAFTIMLGYGNSYVGTYRYRVGWSTNTPSATAYSSVFVLTRQAALRATTHRTLASEVSLSWRPRCPVGPSQLTTIDMNHWGFDGRIHRGRLIVRSDVAGDMIAAFGRAFDARFPIRQMRDPSAFGNDDRVSMAADNTYAFSCRPVTGNPGRVSPHSYGRAIDINPVENPYREPDGRWSPDKGAAYINRSIARPGMLYAGSALTLALRARGFAWYLGWDYQHFQK